MDLLSSNSMLLMEKAMGFLWTRQAAYLDNITNADTPNYKPKVVSFEDSLREQLELAMAPVGPHRAGGSGNPGGHPHG